MHNSLSRRRFTLAVAGIVSLPRLSFCQVNERPVSPEEREGARQSALEILQTLDAVPLSLAQMKQLYLTSGLALQNRYKLAAYESRLKSVRMPLGPVKTRRFHGYSGGFNSLPNIIDGDYIIAGFRTEFVNKVGEYTEQVTLEKDRGGTQTFRFVEYYVAALTKDEE